MKRSEKYKYLFFDLDRTLWDYKANSIQTLNDLLLEFAPELKNNASKFIECFYEINEDLWLQYRDGLITKKELSENRFVKVFDRFNINARPFIKQITDYYIVEGPKKNKLFPGTIEILTYLKSKGYQLFLLTNGFLEVQKVKIKSSKIETFFEGMITSEEVGHQKPNYEIFEYALNSINAKKSECIMIGDDLVNDISGALNFGIDAVFFNPEQYEHLGKPTFEINSLSELKDIL